MARYKPDPLEKAEAAKSTIDHVKDENGCVVTYRRPKIPDKMLEDNLPEPKVEFGYLPAPHDGELGTLSCLPPHVMDNILEELDLKTLIRFRRVNRRAVEAVHDLRRFRLALKHAYPTIRGALCIGAAKHFTFRNLWDTLCRATCEECGDFSSFIYLITCKRVCLLCLKDVKYRPIKPVQVVALFRLDEKDVPAIPQVRNIRGRYGPENAQVHSVVPLVDWQSAYNRACAVHGEEKLQEILENAPPLNPVNKRLEHPHRYIAMSRAPYYNERTGDVEGGFYCGGCLRVGDRKERGRHWRQQYSKASYDTHLAQYGTVKDLQHENVADGITGIGQSMISYRTNCGINSKGLDVYFV